MITPLIFIFISCYAELVLFSEYIWLYRVFCHYWDFFSPFWQKMPEKRPFFVTIFSSNVPFRVILSQSKIAHMLKVIKIKHFRYNELKKVNEPCILSTRITNGTQMCLSENDNFFPENSSFWQKLNVKIPISPWMK